jgi:acetoin utilization protein AcuB
MFVGSRMSKKCTCVSPKDPLVKVYETMREKGYEGLPVSSEGQVVGVITLWDILLRLAQIDHTEEYLKNTFVGEIMTRQPVTIHEDEIIEEAAWLMHKHDINILPVLDRHNQVIGVITQSDFFRVFIEALGIERRGTRITIRTEDRVGELARITSIVKDQKMSIISLVTFEPGRSHADVVLRIESENAKPVVDALKNAGFHVTHVSQVWT